jgi:hypothetical protein
LDVVISEPETETLKNTSLPRKQKKGKKKKYWQTSHLLRFSVHSAFAPSNMAYTMYGMPFANQITPMHQISNTPFYGMPHQPSMSSYYPGAVSYGLPFAPQPFVGVHGNSFVSNVGHSENPMFYTQYAKTASSSSMTSTDLVKARKGIDSRKDQSKENVSSQTKTSPVKVKTSEESTIRYLP